MIPPVLDRNLEVGETEEKWAKQIDNTLQQRMGRSPNWARLCYWLTGVYTVLNMLGCMYRADFLNVTVCAIAIYLLTSANEIQKKTFRLLVFGTFVSFIYDIVWHFMQSESADAASEAGTGGFLRSFVHWVLLFMMVFKIVMMFVFWKASVDFPALIDERSVLFR